MERAALFAARRFHAAFETSIPSMIVTSLRGDC